MSYRGRVRNGVVEFEDGPVPPDGTAVRIEPIDASDQATDAAEEYVRTMMEIAGTARGLPADLARNHDHYLHGRPKK